MTPWAINDLVEAKRNPAKAGLLLRPHIYFKEALSRPRMAIFPVVISVGHRMKVTDSATDTGAAWVPAAC
jgi:hypothetical protein